MSDNEWPGAKVIRARRLQLGMTQAKLGDLTGMGQRQYQRYEAGGREPSLSGARAIAEALDLSLSEIAGQSDPAARPASSSPAADTVGAAIEARRRQIGLTQLTAAATAGLTVEQFQRYETGADELTLASATAIATALDMPLAELAGIVPRAVDLNGQWWSSWQGAQDQAETSETHDVTVLQAGERLLLDSGWRGELRMWGNEVLIGWYRPATTMARTRLGVFLWMPTNENYLYGRWSGVAANNAVIFGWCAMAREEGKVAELMDNLVHGNKQPRPALRLPGLSSWG